MTTYDVLMTLENDCDIEDENIERIRHFLEACDLVKFAKHIPDQEGIATITPQAREIVDNTRRIFVEEPAMTPVESSVPAQEEEAAA